MSVVSREADRASGAGALAVLPFPSAPAQLAVLSTKLEPPYQRPGIIARSRLVARLAGAPTPMVAVIAPAGYGKSTALSQVGDVTHRQIAWLSADSRDGDPATLIRHIAAAIDRVAPLSPETIARVATPGSSVWLTAVPRVGAALKAATNVTLVIDDIDRIHETDAIDVVLAIVDMVRGPGRVMVAGRSAGLLPAARLVSRGILTTFGRDDLALDRTETAELLSATGVQLASHDVQAVSDRTEGWAAGIYLSALGSSSSAAPGAELSVVAPDRLVEEFFRTEVLDVLRPEEAQLLISSSVLERLSGPLCDAVLGRRRSGAMLDRLERTNLFLIPLDQERTWFRFHHLLGDFLRAELERTDPAGAADLRGRAAEWHQENGLPEAALEYAMAAGDEDRAAALTVTLGQTVMNAGRVDTVRRWFGWFDERAAGPRHPRLAAYAAIVFAMEGDGGRAERWADLADRRDDHEGDATDVGLRAIGRTLLARHGMARMVEDAQIAARIIPDGDPWRVAALTALGLAHQLQGEVEVAEGLFEEAVARWNEGRMANTAVCLALTQLAATALERGDRTAAERHIRMARKVLIENGLIEQSIAIGIDALDARLAIAHGALEQARADLAHAQRLRPSVTYTTPWLAIRARLDLIRAHLAMGDGGGARTLMAEVREILVLRPDMGTLLDERDELVKRLSAVRGGEAGASTLTLAELRVLPLLTTHLTFREIGERLFVSQNTVKTQAISIYRKLEATSRSEAITRAVELGLLE